MKVFEKHWQFVAAVLVLSISMLHYVMAAELHQKQQQHHQRQQHSKQRQLQHQHQKAEVNDAGQAEEEETGRKIRFGTKTATITRLTEQRQQQPPSSRRSGQHFAPHAPPKQSTPRQQQPTSQRTSASTSAEEAAATFSTLSQSINTTTRDTRRISRKYESPLNSAASTSQLIAPYDIPIVHKRPTVSAQQRSRQRTAMSSAAATQSPSANRRSAQTRSTLQSQIPNSNRLNSNVNNRNFSSSKTGDTIARSGAAVNEARGGVKSTKKTTTTSTTSTTSRTFLGNFQLNNPFELLQQNFWNLSAPPFEETFAATEPQEVTRKPPKKYKPLPTSHSLAIDKISYQKPPTVIEAKSSKATTEAPTNSKPQHIDGPFRIALPTYNLLSAPPTTPDKEKEKRATAQSLRERFNCPRESEVRFQLFPKICKVDKDCSIWNRDELCCEIFGAKSCVTGVPKPLEETSHTPILGVIPRKCPTRPLAELWWDVKECNTDQDCWPRVCCPDGRRRYCRTSQPELEVVPVPVKRSFNYLTEYLECTAPPPPIFDLHPKACTSTFDCFPNVCCQEAGLRHCRPPKKSLLTLMANFLNVDFVKRLTQNIVIK